jgi:hypothetical protein
MPVLSLIRQLGLFPASIASAANAPCFHLRNKIIEACEVEEGGIMEKRTVQLFPLLQKGYE